MNSKFKSQCSILILISTISSLMISCSLKLGEDAPPVKPFVYPETCLSESYDKLAKLIDTTATDRDISFAADCVGSILGRLRDKVRGEKKDYFKDTELSEFIENNLFEDGSKRRISPELLHQGMLIKQLFVGGSDQFLTREEISKSISFFNRLKTQLILINPFLQVYLQKWEAKSLSESHRDLGLYDGDIEYFEKSNTVLQDFIGFIASELEGNQASYALDNIPKLVRELDLFDNVDSGYGETAARFTPLIKTLKRALSGGQDGLVLSTEWRNFGVLGSRGYIQYLRYLYFIKAAPEAGLQSQLPYIARAAEEIFDTLSYLVARKPEQKMSRLEILDVFNAFAAIFPNVKMSDSLLLEFMKIKQVILGGQVDVLTDRDFLVAKSRVPIFQTVAEKITPYFRVYVLDWDGKNYSKPQAKEFFETAMLQLAFAVQTLKPIFVASYELNDLKTLIEELRRLYPSPMSENNISSIVQKYLPLFINFKEIVTDRAGSKVETDQWSTMLLNATEALRIYLDYHYFVESESLSSNKLLETQEVVQRTSQLLQSIAVSKSGRQIKNTELLSVLINLKAFDIVPNKLSEATMTSLLEAAANRIFLSPQERFKGVHRTGFSTFQIQQMQSDLESFLFTYQNTQVLTQSEKVGVEPVRVFNMIDQLMSSSNLRVDFREALQELRVLISGPVLMNFDDRGRMYIGQVGLMSSSSLLRLNLSRTLAALLIRSYSDEATRADVLNGAINVTEAKNFFDLLTPILKELELLKDIDPNFVNSRFLEANIFVARGQYDEWVTFAEASELVVHLLSGLELAAEIKLDFQNVQGDCRAPTVESPLPLLCYQKITKQIYGSELLQMPRLAAAVTAMTDADWAVFINAAILAAGYDGGVLKDTVKLSEMNLVPHFIQYLEMLFAKFDTNHDEVINTEESAAAFQTFASVLKEVAKPQLDDGSITEAQLYDLFTYILKNSKAPESNLEKLKFKLSWIGKPQNWNLAVNRKSVGTTLKYISESIAKARKLELERKRRDPIERLKRLLRP